MYKRNTLLLLGISLALLVGLFFLTKFIDKKVDDRFSNLSTESANKAQLQENNIPQKDTIAGNSDLFGEEAKAPGEAIPTFTIYNKQNKAFHLEDFSDRPVVLYFWASHSKSSTAGLSVMERFFQKHGNKVYFVIVDVVDGDKETRSKSDLFLQSKDYSFPIYYDLDGLCNEYYGKKVPLAIFFDKSGTAITYFNEQPTSNLMQSCFQKILN